MLGLGQISVILSILECVLSRFSWAASPRDMTIFVTPSLSELSALDDMGPLWAIMMKYLGYSQRSTVRMKFFDSQCNWPLMLGRACTKKGRLER